MTKKKTTKKAPAAAPAPAPASSAPASNPTAAITTGRTVLFRLPTTDPTDVRLRPALVVNGPMGPSNLANLSVALDPFNDLARRVEADGTSKSVLDVGACNAIGAVHGEGDATMHVPSAREGTSAGQWRWPTRS